MGSGRSSQKAGGRKAAKPMRLRGMTDIYRYFRNNETPVYFISPTAYNLLGMDQWVHGFRYVTYFDSFAGAQPHSFSPTHTGPRDFESFESVNTYLLGHKEVRDYISAHGPGQALFVMFDEETEELAAELGLSIALPPLELRKRIDSKLETTRLGEQAKVASVPNVLADVDSYKRLRKLAKKHELGKELVVQTPYGDSGRTTFFIRSEEDFAKHEDVLTSEPLKVMRFVRHLPGTVEAVATRHGTLVGPVQTDITGFAELTPYRGGWCGNDISPYVFTKKIRRRIRKMAQRLGARLYAEGYRGVFCMDYLVAEDGTVYLGEINPRISGASPLTSLITTLYGGVPLFLFHLLEFSDVDWEVDLESVQERWAEFDTWSQLVLKQVTDDVELITEAPPSGLWRMDEDGSVRFLRNEHDWHAVGGEDEAFYMQVYGSGEYRYPGADIGILVTRGRMQTDDRMLTDRAKAWAEAIGSRFAGVPPEQAFRTPTSLAYTKWF